MLTSRERRLEPGVPADTAAAGNDPQGAPCSNRLLPALHRVAAGVLVGDRCFAGAPGDVVDEHGGRSGQALQARSQVDRIAQDHPLALASHINCGQSGDDPGAGAELGEPDLLPKRRNRLDDRKRRTRRPLGVVLARHGAPPDRHQRVSDELLNGAAQLFDQRARSIEVAGE